MQLPVDVKALLSAATDIESAKNTPLSVSVYIDDTAPGDVVGHVRNAFASAGAHTRVTIGYLDDGRLTPHETDDMAVIVAGVAEHVGACARELRAAGVPAMVATTCPALVRDMAAAMSNAIPEGDLVAPEAPAGAEAQAAEAAGDDEPIALDDAARASLNKRMGEWILDACSGKKLAFALAFPFVRNPLSIDVVKATALQNAGIGAVLFIPGADMPVMTLNQAKMLLQIAAAYGQPMTIQRVKELAAVVGGAFACRSVARQLAGVVPGLGWAVKAGVGYTGTLAMGYAAIEYFEKGGSIAGLAGVVSKARDKAVETASAAAATPAGAKALSAVKTAAGAALKKARENR